MSRAIVNSALISSFNIIDLTNIDDENVTSMQNIIDISNDEIVKDEIIDNVDNDDSQDNIPLNRLIRSRDKDKSKKTKRSRQESEIDENICCICCSEIESRGLIDCCKHEYCFACIKEWAKQSLTCPQCRRKFKRIVQVDKNRKILTRYFVKQERVYQLSTGAAITVNIHIPLHQHRR